MPAPRKGTYCVSRGYWAAWCTGDSQVDPKPCEYAHWAPRGREAHGSGKFAEQGAPHNAVRQAQMRGIRYQRSRVCIPHCCTPSLRAYRVCNRHCPVLDPCKSASPCAVDGAFEGLRAPFKVRRRRRHRAGGARAIPGLNGTNVGLTTVDYTRISRCPIM